MRSFKTAHHAHTTNSPGDGQVSLRGVIEAHYRTGFDILCVADHNYLTRDWMIASRGTTKERFAEIAAGVGRGGQAMLQVPLVCEQSRHNHVNTFFVDYVNVSGDTPENLRRTLQEVETRHGLAHLNHPGRYTGGETNPSKSSDPEQIGKYLELFASDFVNCIGMEIINKKDGESRNDRILWDNINAQTMPKGRTVWGFSNDDSHRNSEIGFSFNMMFMADNTLEEFREAMLHGRFYAVAKVAHNEEVNSQDLSVPTPLITDIVLNRDDACITIVADHYQHIDWLAAQGKVSTGETLHLGDHPNVGDFVRANVIGQGGIAFTQPIGVPF